MDMDLTGKCLQETYAPNNFCFGCGPANPQGLRIRSFLEGDQLIARFSPQQHHRGFDQILNGGIIGALLDCHCNWMAAYHLMTRRELNIPPCTVTAQYTITFDAPTPANEDIVLRAWIVDSSDRRATVKGSLETSKRIVTARCDGVFVAVKEGHPAYHRW